MVGPAGLMALWMIAATPASAMFDVDGRNDEVKRAILRNEVFIRGKRAGGVWNAPLPPPRMLPYDPAYESAGPVPQPSSPLNKSDFGSLGATAGSSSSDFRKFLPCTAGQASSGTLFQQAPSSEGIPGLPPVEETPKPPPPKKIIERRDIINYDEDFGEAFCSDEGAGNPCGYDCGCRPGRRGLRGWFDGVCWEGWLDQGFTLNTLSPRNRTNGPVTFNNRSNEYQLNQLYMRLVRDVDSEGCDWDVGGRMDLLYGADSIYVTARGLEVRGDLSPKWNAQRYGLAMPQCYMEVYSPWGNGLSMKLGHFYSILGYESVEAPKNFFYSHSYLFQYAEPFTETGFLGETRLGDFTIRAGMTRGFNNWEDNNNDMGFLGGINWASRNRRTKIALCVDAAREQADPSTNVSSVYSLVFQQKLGRRWECVLQSDYGNEPGAGIDRSTAKCYGLDTYLFYTINDRWKAGMRFEWFRDEGGARVPGANRTADYFELSSGVNWTPSERLIVRSELRWDWTGTTGYSPFGDGTRSNQVLLNCDVIVRF